MCGGEKSWGNANEMCYTYFTRDPARQAFPSLPEKSTIGPENFVQHGDNYWLIGGAHYTSMLFPNLAACYNYMLIHKLVKLTDLPLHVLGII